MENLSEAQATILAECLSALDAGIGIEECLASYLEEADALRPYLELRAELLSAERPEPSAADYHAGRQALLERLNEEPARQPKLVPSVWPGWAAPLAQGWQAFSQRTRKLFAGWTRIDSPLTRVAAAGAAIFLLGGSVLGASAAGFTPAHDVLSALHIVDDEPDGGDDVLVHGDDGIKDDHPPDEEEPADDEKEPPASEPGDDKKDGDKDGPVDDGKDPKDGEEPTHDEKPYPNDEPTHDDKPDGTRPTEEPHEEPNDEPRDKPPHEEEPKPEPTDKPPHEEEPKPEPTDKPPHEEKPKPEPTDKPPHEEEPKPTDEPKPEPTPSDGPKPTDEPKPEPTEPKPTEPKPTEEPIK